MSLADQLSLSKNGGVYYDGTRVHPTDDPILFVGLGGTGADAILRVKNEVQTRMYLPKGDDGRILSTSPANIAFLAIDGDQEVLNKTCGVAGFDQNGDELIQISVDGMEQVVQDVVTKHLKEPQWDWYDPDLPANGGLQGANGIRQIGRFMLCWNFQTVKTRIDTAIRKLLMDARNNKLKIFVLTGVGGGTGSGTFLDVAYLLRAIAAPLTPNVQVHGYIFTPDLNKGNGGDEPSMYRNGFASLKELDYWMSASEHQQHFIQHYAGGYVIDSIALPFDFCHIITAQDAQHNLITYREALEAVGSNLFSYIVSERMLKETDPQAMKSMYDNISGHIAMAQKPYPANYYYLSVGSHKLEIPYTEITTLVAARVFEKLEPVFQREPNRETFAFDLNALQLTYDHLWGFIHRNVQANPLQGHKFGYNDIWPNNRPYQMVYQWLNGHAQQQLRTNRVNFTGVAEGILRQYLERLIKSEERGPCYAARMIRSNTSFCLIRTMEGFRDDCRERMATASGRLPGLKTTMEQQFAGGRNAGVFSRGRVAQEYMDALTEWLETEYAYWGYAELADALDDFVKRLQKYHERIFKRLLDSLVILPGIFRENVNMIIVAEQSAQKDTAASERYLIRPLEFEKKYAHELENKVKTAATVFFQTLGADLKRWVGLSMDEVDSAIVASTDIGGAIAEFINDNFSTTLSMNMEELLQRRILAGQNTDGFYYDTLRGLRENAIPMYHTGVQHQNLDIKTFSMVSIPDDCPAIYQVALDKIASSEDRPKSSNERSKLQWVKVQAGMPLFAFPEVSEMEKKYEQAMTTSRETRRGVHLRWDWREQLPSPLPERTWKDDATAGHKTYSREYNAAVREAFQKCLDGGIIREAPGGECALLFVAPEGALQGVELHGTVREKMDQLDMLRRTLWSNEATAVKLNPFGSAADGTTLIDRVQENVLRFYNVSTELKRQANLLAQFETLMADFSNVEQYVNALFSGLIYDQGYERKFRRAENDYVPINLFDKMTQTSDPDYETFKAFCKILTQEIRGNIATQYDVARKALIGADGNFIKEALAQKLAILSEHEEKFKQALQSVQTKISKTPLEQRGELTAMADFYERAIEMLRQRITAIQ